MYVILHSPDLVVKGGVHYNSLLLFNLFIILLGKVLGKSHTGLVEEVVQRRNGLHET